VGGEFPTTPIADDSGPPLPLEIDEHDQLGAKHHREQSDLLLSKWKCAIIPFGIPMEI
jgi:hypothetical protein